MSGTEKPKEKELEIPEIGQVVLRQIVRTDLDQIRQLLKNKQLDSAGFASKVVFAQLSSPQFDFDKFSSIPVAQLAKVVEDLKRINPAVFGDSQKLMRSHDEQFKILKEDLVKRVSEVHRSNPIGDLNIAAIESSALTFLKNINSASQELAKAIRGPLKRIETTLTALQKNLNAWISSNSQIFQKLDSYWEAFERGSRVSRARVIAILDKYNWLATPSVPHSLLINLLLLDSEPRQTRAAVNRLFVDHFSKNNWTNLREMIDSWEGKAIRKERLNIIRNCARVVSSPPKETNAASVVLPALVAQIDGQMSDYLKIRGIEYQNLFGIKGRGRKKLFRENVSPLNDPDFHDLSMNLFLDVFLAYSHDDNRAAILYNRHEIMHGWSLHYGRKDYLIKTFLLLDFLAHLE